MNPTPEKPTLKSLIKYFINKFRAIPEERWCVFTMVNDKGQRCALGHTTLDGTWSTATNETKQIELIFRGRSNDIANINNGVSVNYPQPTPKQRVLAALNDQLRKEL